MDKQIKIFNGSTFNLRDFILSMSFYERDTAIVAKELLGKILMAKPAGEDFKSGICAGRIVDIEAYYGSDDPASHAFRGPTPRSRIMFGIPGISYVYFCYGNHYIINAVTEKNGIPGAAMIRALEPLAGIDLMMERRHTDCIENLASGPGKLTQALGINMDFNGMDLTEPGSRVIMLDDAKLNLIPPVNKADIASSPRIGIKNAAGELLRFYLKGNNYISKK
jgi:DNA-3-methyladenine glycosylase